MILTEPAIKELGKQAAIHVLDRVDDLRLALQHPQISALANSMISAYEARRGLNADDIIGVLVSIDEHMLGISTAVLVLYDFFDKEGLL